MRVPTAARWNADARTRTRITRAADDRSYCSCCGFSQKGKLPAYRRSRRNSWDVNAAFTRRGEAAAHVPHSPRRISRARAICSPRAL